MNILYLMAQTVSKYKPQENTVTSWDRKTSDLLNKINEATKVLDKDRVEAVLAELSKHAVSL